MTRQIWVRVGALGQIRPLVVSDSTDYPRLTRVICQTKRGLEIGETLAPVEQPTGEPEGTVMRALRPDDDAHLARLRLRSDAAFRSCRQWMQQSRMSAVLIDVELLFDGRSMNLYFADQIPARVELLRQQLARTYQAIVRFHAIESEPSAGSSGRAVDCSGGGCGASDCGGGSAHTHAPLAQPAGNQGGCRSGGCSTCSVADICGKRKRLYADVPTAG